MNSSVKERPSWLNLWRFITIHYHAREQMEERFSEAVYSKKLLETFFTPFQRKCEDYLPYQPLFALLLDFSKNFSVIYINHKLAKNPIRKFVDE